MSKKIRQIVDVVAKVVLDTGTKLAQQEGTQALAQAQALKQTLQDSLDTNPAYRSMWQQFQANPQENAPILAEIIKVMYQNDSNLAQRLDTLLDAYQQVPQPSIRENSTNINTGGGAYIGGAVQVSDGSQFSGRDQTIVTQNAIETAQVFQDFYRQISENPELNDMDKADIKAELKEVETELTKGPQANENMIRRRLRNIQRMAPDILDVILTTFANPMLGLGTVAKKVAEKMKTSADEKD
jgi:uncharacterized protein YneF (UPF0154 family)